MIAICSLKNELQEFQECFSASDPLQNSIEQNRQLLKDTIQKAISRHIPSKLARRRDKLPWISPLIEQKMKLRKCLYDKAKWTNIYTDSVTTRKLEMRSTAYLKLPTVTTIPICLVTPPQVKKDSGHILKLKERITLELHHWRMEKIFTPVLNTRLAS